MQTKFYIQAAILLFTIVLVNFSCDSKSGDNTPPVIKLNSPAEGAVLKIGDTHGIHLDMDLSDNEGLASYKIDIHNAFDNHEHHRSHAGVEQGTVPFTFNKSWDDIAGLKNKHVHHHEIVIPANATPGKYHLVVFCTDEAKNESYVARNIVLSHEGESGHEHHQHH